MQGMKKIQGNSLLESFDLSGIMSPWGVYCAIMLDEGMKDHIIYLITSLVIQFTIITNMINLSLGKH